MPKSVLADLLTKLDTLPKTRKDALASGVGHYYTGKPCKRGHLVPRGRHGTCMECHRLSVLIGYQENPEPQRERSKRDSARRKQENPERERSIKNKNCRNHRAAHIEKYRERDRQNRAANLEEHRRRERERYHADPEHYRGKTKRWRLDNLDQAYEKHREWVAANPEKVREHDRNKRAKRKGAEGRHTNKDIARIRAEQNDQCAFCLEALLGKGHVDHKTPLVRGGTNWPDNLQLLCVSCNCSKHDKTVEEFWDYVEELTGVRSLT